MRSQNKRVNISASDNSLAAYHVQVCHRCGQHAQETRALLQRDLRVWGTPALLAMAAFCVYVWDISMQALPAYQRDYAISYSVIQTATLLLAAMVLWAWGERALKAIRGSRTGLGVCLVAAGMLGAPAAQAAAPEDGIWWNPSAPGRGWVIVSQDDLMAVSSYTYGANGAAVWYLSVGTFNDSTRRFSGTLDETRGGQCIGCPYTAPTVVGSAGPLTITFGANETATLTQNGQVVPIEKFYYGYPNRDDRLYGEWAYSSHVSFGVGDAEFLIFDKQFIGSNGKRYVQLRRRFTTVGLGLGSFEPTLNEYLVLLDSSTSYNKLYQFKMEANRFLDGRYWLYLKTNQPTGNGSFTTGVRVRERNDVGAPAQAKGTGDDAAMVAIEAEMMKAMPASDAPLDPVLLEAVSEMARELELMQKAEAQVDPLN